MSYYKDLPIPEGSVDLAQASFMLGYCPSYGRRLIKNKMLKAKKLGKKWIVKLTDIEDFKMERSRECERR